MKWYSYIICVVCIIIGVFFGLSWYQDVTATSYVNGDINITNQFSQEQFNYSSSAVAFYPTENSESFSFETELVKTNGFNGERKDYTVKLNEYVLTETTITAGAVKADVKMDFYDTEGKVVCNGELTVVIRFLSDKTQLILSCPTQSSATFFENYFTDNGIRLQVIENL